MPGGTNLYYVVRFPDGLKRLPASELTVAPAQNSVTKNELIPLEPQAELRRSKREIVRPITYKQ